MKISTDTLLPVVTLLLQSIIPIALVWIGKHTSTQKDAARAAALQHIADGAAALVLANNPANAWAQLLKRTIEMLQQSPAVPTTNAEALERAAASALTRLGVKPAR